MISLERFLELANTEAGRDLSRHPEQRDAVSATRAESLFIVAGPGTGKTTVLALRVLKLVFVDDMDPSGIVATTFTRRAAAELRSRILGWGDQFRKACLRQRNLPAQLRSQIECLDLNRIVTGTLDSIAEGILGDYRPPGTQPPIVIEQFVASAFMLRDGLFPQGRHTDTSLKDYIEQLRGDAFGLNTPELGRILLAVRERIVQDRVDAVKFQFDPRPSGTPIHAGISISCATIDDYIGKLQAELVKDFVALEQDFLLQLRNGALNKFLNALQVVFVDEYQDTNLLQEQIYFELTRAVLAHGGGITVVGDDDQSLYRFRGATVDLFQAFPRRLAQELKITPRLIFLAQNYRSTQNIVTFTNGFVTLDKRYQTVRVKGKPSLVCSRTNRNPKKPIINYPLIGMFRDDVHQLAHDLADFVHSCCHGTGVTVLGSGASYNVRVDPTEGTVGDCALLCSSPREFSFSGDARLPLLLRNELSAQSPPIRVFNPRGQDLASLTDVQSLCGLVLECIDPQSQVQGSITKLPQTVIQTLNEWRQAAQSYISTNPKPRIQGWPRQPRTLADFVKAWQSRQQQRGKSWEKRVGLVQLVYKLVTWIPNLQDDIEGLVYLEAVARTMTEASRFSDFSSEIVRDPKNPGLEAASIRDAIWNILVPLASGAVEIDEDLLDTLPGDRLNILSVHQSKGLEFPLVIVDVGSDFRTNHAKQAFKRFPRSGGLSCSLEDELRDFCPLGRPRRSALDRAFDDLTRQYFVAYSRAQDVVLLVGLNSVRNRIQNIATGWDRDGSWHWGMGLPNLTHI